MRLAMDMSSRLTAFPLIDPLFCGPQGPLGGGWNNYFDFTAAE
jgi:hypothetical protein